MTKSRLAYDDQDEAPRRDAWNKPRSLEHLDCVANAADAVPKRVIEDFKIFIKQVEHEYDYTFPSNDEGFPQLAFPE